MSLGFGSIEQAQERAKQLDAQIGNSIHQSEFAPVRVTSAPQSTLPFEQWTPEQKAQWFGYRDIQEARMHLASLEARVAAQR
ncbi:hypothetical protein LMH73_009310 [Vibrio splendidus]|nr:hypothetical protein [Vibrio splendidus]MCC4881855.1 hypothetical protein [Vibrio splendidus]